MLPFSKNKTYHSLYTKYAPYTMVPEAHFIENLKIFQKSKGLEGDFVECGVWKGGMSAAAADLLKDERTYYLFDSFEGLPTAEDIDGAAAKAWQKNTDSPWFFDNCAADESFAEKAMQLSRCRHYKIVKGWFENTLPSTAFNRPIAILRLDADWYKSTYYCLEQLFPKLVENGIVIIDDYYTWDGCTRAVHDYLSHTQSAARIYQTPGGVCYLVKK